MQRPAPSPVPDLGFPRGKGRIAIVLDDWGHNLRHVPILSSVRSPLTLAVLPNLPYSDEVARAADEQGHEVILHMPMQAVNPNAPREPGTILGGMTSGQVAALLDQALQTVPGAVGMSNHQGSKVTADRAVMEVVLREAKRRRLYFLDSYVTQRSVCRDLAERLGLAFAQRTVFLDNEEMPQAIQQRLTELAHLAGQRGQAIGIGHDRPVTMEILQRAIPALEKAGYTLVPVSKLIDSDPSRE